MSKELTDLVEVRQILQEQLVEINKEIDKRQIIRPTDLMTLGFSKITNGDKYAVYTKKLNEALLYEVILDITNPNRVIICKKFQKETSQFNFNLQNLQAFVTLLMQLEVV